MKITISQEIVLPIPSAILLPNETDIMKNSGGRNPDMMISTKDSPSEKRRKLN